MRWKRRWGKRLRALTSRAVLERELADELAFHLEMETEKNIRDGMNPEEARRRARLSFGAMEAHREAVRDARWLGWSHGLSLDVKLGVRMLRKYPGLTAVSGVAVVVATCLGAALFEFSSIYNPQWPYPEAHRVVSVQTWDRETGQPERRAMAHLGVWQESSRSFSALGGVVQRDLALVTEEARSEVVESVQMGVQAFSIPRVSPLLGRPLQAEDEASGAPAVVVLGHGVWERLFDRDPGVIGRTVRVGAEPATVVGVMPAGFRFPLNEEVWLPLPRELLASAPREGPPVIVLGRLAPGVTPAQAEAELAALAGADPRLAVAAGAEHLRPRVRGLTDALFGSAAVKWAVYGARVLFLLLMLVICINIATLVFARAAMRGGEMAVRSALGASRRRIVGQMFIEGLALTALPALIGLGLAAWGFPRVMALFWEVQEMTPPFWADGRVDPWTAAYVGVLAVFGGVVVGVLPALKATRGGLRTRLGELSAGSRDLRFGGIWTVVIVVQVAVSAALLPFTMIEARTALRDAERASGFPADHFLNARISLDDRALGAGGDAGTLNASLLDEVLRRVSAEPGVVGAAYATRLAGLNHEMEGVEVEGSPGGGEGVSHYLRRLDVDPEFLHLVGGRVVAGRGLGPDDYAAETGGVLVNEAFVREVMGGVDPSGLRLRYVGGRNGEASPWYEVAGVVSDLEMDEFGLGVHRAVYHPLDLHRGGAQLFVRLHEPDPAAVSRLLGVASAVDARLQVGTVRTVRDSWRPAHTGNRWIAGMWISLATISLLLSMAGIHAMMAFIVARRAREIGIRRALGSGRLRIVGTVFRRALAQVTAGVLVGWAIAFPAIRADWSAQGPGAFLAVGAVLLLAGFVAAVRPAARALAVEPVDAMRVGV
jgi:putative ABC transport system permease protein